METQTDYILINMRQYSSVRDVRYFTGTACHNDHDTVVEKIEERLSVIQACSKSQIGLPALDNFDDNMESNRVGERIIGNTDNENLCNCELK